VFFCSEIATGGGGATFAIGCSTDGNACAWLIALTDLWSGEITDVKWFEMDGSGGCLRHRPFRETFDLRTHQAYAAPDRNFAPIPTLMNRAEAARYRAE
jgi:hypothetical protein